MSLATIKEFVMATSLVHSGIELSDDVNQLAGKLGIAAYLPKVLGMTRVGIGGCMTAARRTWPPRFG
jgi:hypothetical protein